MKTIKKLKRLLLTTAILIGLSSTVYAAIDKEIIQCGTEDQLAISCQENEECCIFLELIKGDRTNFQSSGKRIFEIEKTKFYKVYREALIQE